MYFDELKLEKIPTIKALQQEYATLAAERKQLYSGYSAKRDYMREVLTAEQNVSLMQRNRDRNHEQKRDKRER